LVDGDSEIVYLNKIKPSNIKIKPELPSKKRLKDWYNKFKNYKKNFPENILINNPYLEYWFYLLLVIAVILVINAIVLSLSLKNLIIYWTPLNTLHFHI